MSESSSSTNTDELIDKLAARVLSPSPRRLAKIGLVAAVAGAMAIVLVVLMVWNVYALISSRHERQVDINRGVDIRLCQVLDFSVDRTKAPDAGEIGLRKQLSCAPRRFP